MRLLTLYSLAAAVLLPGALAGKPFVHKTTFKNLPSALFYFEDSPALLTFDPRGSDVYRSGNDGRDWTIVEELNGKSIEIVQHPFDKDRAVVFGKHKEHWATKDKGKTWRKFEADLPMSVRQFPLSFSAANPDHVLYAGQECDPDDFWGLNCVDKTFYTKDWFENMKTLTGGTHACLFARGNKLFTEGHEDTVFCIVDGEDKYPEHRKLLTSTNFFQDSTEPRLDGYNNVRGLAGLASVSKFIVAAVRSSGTEEMALYVSNNATTWDRAEFPQDHGGLKEDAYTILESTPYSIQVDVLTTSVFSAPIGELFTSNSNGTYFTRDLNNTNRIPKGLVDFEQIEGIDGIMIANIVANAEEVKGNGRREKKLQTKISFDDGKMGTWKPLKTDGKELHLHSITELANGGRVFSSRAPGLVMGVGNTGDYLDYYTNGDLYISEDAGLTWTKTRTEAHKYEFGGAGSIIVAVFDEGFTNKVSYSKDHGKNWEDVDLGVEIRARLLTTTPDSTSLKFLLVGNSKDKKAHIFSLEFDDVFDGKKCKLDKDNESKSDYVKWYARYDDDGKPDCLMGRKQYFWRRKKDADCSAGELYKEPVAESEVCDCQAQDFECDFNFVRDNNECVLAPGAKLPIPPNECKNPNDEYMGPSGYRKIPGNSCSNGVNKEEPVRRKCSEAISSPSTGKIVSTTSEFRAKKPMDYFYLKNAETVSTEEETIFMMTDKQEIWVSHNGGREWEHVLKDAKVIAVYPHPHEWKHVYFVTNSKTIHYTTDRGHSFGEMQAPDLPNRQGIPFMDFHPRKNGWFIWHGQKDCSDPMKCHTIAKYTISAGEEWHVLKSYSGPCKWVRAQRKETPDKLVFCEHAANENPRAETMELLSSSNFFEDETKHFDRIIGFAIMQEFIIVAGVKDDSSLQASASVDGQTFADAHFPHGFNVPHQTAYTVLDSLTHSVFLHVTVNDRRGYEYGSLLKSNSNGTNYVLSLDAVNRNEDGFVDFERMQVLEGIAIANRVVNYEAAARGEKKKLRSVITHNDGGKWDYITPPTKDSEGKAYNKCGDNLEECSLNFHHYTERTDPRHTFSSGSAIGLMMAVGNVGDELTKFADADTFLTTDGGLTWKEVRKGQYLWEFGDQGSIIVIVDRAKPTDTVLYTLDEGRSWLEYKFSEKMKVTDITTVPMDNSRKFLLWGYKEGNREKFYTVHLDFSGITDQQCKLDETKNGDNDDDFFLWSPRTKGHDCLFGHKAQYHRKIPDRRCYIGRKLDRLRRILNNCTCVAEDFECDFNYERKSDNTCKLVQGLPPVDHSAVCKDPNVDEYYKPGYRRLPASTCQGGNELDKLDPKPCPGKKLKSGTSGFGLFMAVVIPIVAAGGVGYYVWTRVLNGRIGAIRLGEDNDSSLVQYPIIAISAVVAVVLAIPSILSALGGWLASKFTRTRRYTTRNSFARGGDYSVVHTDEGELLGSDDDDEV